MYREKMRNYLRFFVIMAAMLSMACNKEIPNTPEPEEPNNKVEETFRFANALTSSNRLSVDIITENQEMEYILLLAEKKYFILNDIDSRDELLYDDLNYLIQLTSKYNSGLHDSLEDLGVLARGNKENYMAVNLYPGTEYVVYCYGVEFDGDSYTVTTDVCYTVLETIAPEMQDVKFDIDCATDGNITDITIEPIDYDGYYYYYLVAEDSREYLEEGKPMDRTYTEIFSNHSYDLFNRIINNEGTSVSDFCMKGKITITERVKPNTKYMIAAFAVNDERVPLLCSVPEVAYFTTGDITKSDLKLDVAVTDITPYNAQLTITPSNNDDSYACVLISKEQEPVEVSDDEKMLLIINMFDPAVFSGTLSQQLTPLMPSTEYVIIAFGIDTYNDLPTTDIYEVHFTSGEASEGSVEITSIELVKLFDTQAIIDADPSYRSILGECECIGIVEAKTNKPCDKLFFWWYEMWMKEEYEEEAFLEDLLMYPYANNPEIMDMYYSMSDDDQFFFAGIAEDEEGNLSDIFYGDNFLLSEDMISPVEEFFPYAEAIRNDDAKATNTYIMGIRK